MLREGCTRCYLYFAIVTEDVCCSTACINGVITKATNNVVNSRACINGIIAKATSNRVSSTSATEVILNGAICGTDFDCVVSTASLNGVNQGSTASVDEVFATSTTTIDVELRGYIASNIQRVIFAAAIEDNFLYSMIFGGATQINYIHGFSAVCFSAYVLNSVCWSIVILVEIASLAIGHSKN